jgi:hypothetical protein
MNEQFTAQYYTLNQFLPPPEYCVNNEKTVYDDLPKVILYLSDGKNSDFLDRQLKKKYDLVL